MAKSSILFPHALQLYVQLLQIREPSPRSSRFASLSRRVPQVLHLKHSMCHRLPARKKKEVSSGSLYPPFFCVELQFALAAERNVNFALQQREIGIIRKDAFKLLEDCITSYSPSSKAFPSSRIYCNLLELIFSVVVDIGDLRFRILYKKMSAPHPCPNSLLPETPSSM